MIHCDSLWQILWFFPNSKEKANSTGEVPTSAKVLRKREEKIDSRNAGRQEAWCGTQQSWKENEVFL